MPNKRLSGIVLFGLFTVAACVGENMYSSGKFTFSYPDGFTGVEETATACNALRSSFNEVFRFDSNDGEATAKIVILADKETFESYVSQRIGEVRSQYLLLRYSDPSRSELVIYPRANASGFDAFSGPALNRQLFLQYLYSAVSEPPLWLRDGFQAYFENLGFDAATGKVTYDQNAPWLETAKTLTDDATKKIGPESLLGALTGSFDSSLFYPQAWAFVTFLVNSENAEYQRFLHESAIILTGDGSGNRKTQEENTAAIRSRFVNFNDTEKVGADFATWLSGQHTFNELVQSGVSLYNAGNYGSALDALGKASAMRGNDPLVTYYLGLVAYARAEYAVADGWYCKALEYGGDASTVNWALGLNAYADKRYAEARIYLETAKSSNPARYEKRVADLVSSMPK